MKKRNPTARKGASVDRDNVEQLLKRPSIWLDVLYLALALISLSVLIYVSIVVIGSSKSISSGHLMKAPTPTTFNASILFGC